MRTAWGVSMGGENGREGELFPARTAGTVSSNQPLEMILARQLASQLSVPMALVDAHGEVLFLNEGARLLLRGGRDIGDVALWASELFVGDDGRPSREPFRTVLQHGEPAHARLYPPVAGTSSAVLVTAFPVRGTAQPLVGAVIVFWHEDRSAAQRCSDHANLN